jgi:Flp pilus assembly protein TadG
MCLRLCARILRRTDGVAAVEFSLIAPFLLAMLLGIMGFGSYLGYAHSLQTVASEAARAAVAGLDSAERVTIATAAAQRSIAASPLLRPNAVTIETGQDTGDPDLFTVTLRYDLNATLLSLIPPLVPIPKSLSRTASIRRGGL